jgi:hypothetical protein
MALRFLNAITSQIPDTGMTVSHDTYVRGLTLKCLACSLVKQTRPMQLRIVRSPPLFVWLLLAKKFGQFGSKGFEPVVAQAKFDAVEVLDVL